MTSVISQVLATSILTLAMLSLSPGVVHANAVGITISSQQWQRSAIAAPPGLMQQMAKENLNPRFWQERSDAQAQLDMMKVLKLQAADQRLPLYLINTRTQYQCPPSGCRSYAGPLCGAAGCAYIGYIPAGKTYQRVFAQYLDSRLPPGVPFFQVSQQLVHGFPCLQFSQLPNGMRAETIQVSQFCFNGQEYVLTPSVDPSAPPK